MPNPTPKNFVEGDASIYTMEVYHQGCTQFIGRFCRQDSDASEMPYSTRVFFAVYAFLNTHDAWSSSHIRRLAVAFIAHVEFLVAIDMMDERTAQRLLDDLRTRRPRPKPQNIDAKDLTYAQLPPTRNAPRKSIANHELRLLIAYLESRGQFSLWVAGYLRVASRLGWRPGEILVLNLDGVRVSALAEKRTNGRGLCDTCEVNLGVYPEWLLVRLEHWINERARWELRYGGDLLRAINTQLVMACIALGLARVATYTFRHFAIACMKASGFKRDEIAVLVNHRTNRTANERYGQAKSGIRRPRKMLGFDRARLLLVKRVVRGVKTAPELDPAPLSAPGALPTR